MQSSWRRGGLVGISALLWLAACARNPMPASLTFEGRKLELATEWSRGSVRGVVFVTPGQKLPLAHLQVGILASTEHKTGKALQAWVTEQYRMSGGIQNHEANEGDESCRSASSSEQAVPAVHQPSGVPDGREAGGVRGYRHRP